MADFVTRDRALFEIENDEGNGIVHWYCSERCRDAETIDYGEVAPLTHPAPDGSICETCGVDL